MKHTYVGDAPANLSPADKAWRDAYYIAYVGASNPRGVDRTFHQLLDAGVDPETHAGMAAIHAHLAFLVDKGYGPDFDQLDAVVRNAARLGMVTLDA